MGVACWLWNYLRRSGAFGFLLPLSGGVNSSSVVAIVGSMSQLVVKEIGNGDEQVKADAIRIGHYMDGEFPRDSKEFAKRIFYTVFMASENSLDGSRNQSRVIAEEIGSWHLDVSINGVVSSLLSLFQTLTGKWPRTKENGGTNVENTALLNIQSRSRMVVAYMLASLLPWVHAKPGFYLLLSTTTADEALSGNLTKYGCSSGDINPIGSINKQDLRSFLKWASTNLGYSSLAQVEEHKDDVELGMSEEELSLYARLRRTFQCGPLSMFENLCAKWGPKLCPREIGEKVKHFFKSYSTNRHKMTVLTPSYLVESNSADDNRFELRQFMYNVWWPYQFRKIDERIVELNGDAEGLLRSSDQEIVRI